MKKLDFINKIGGFLNPDFKNFSEELKRCILQECNYREEVENQIRIKELLKDMPRVYVPKFFKQYCLSNIIVSEFIHGENFFTFSKKANQDSRNIVAKALISSLTTLSFQHRLVYADPQFENFLIKNDKIFILDFGRIYRPQPERMKVETMFYRALIDNKKELAKSIFPHVGFAKDINDFDFDEFWVFLKNSSRHLFHNGNFKFNQEYLKEISREGRRFSQRKKIKLNPDLFWGFTFSAGTWALLAELEAEINFREIASTTFNKSLNI